MTRFIRDESVLDDLRDRLKDFRRSRNGNGRCCSVCQAGTIN